MFPSLHTQATKQRGFTLIELLTVIAIIAILASLILGISGWANKKAAMQRIEGEIKAISSACEAYKSDNAIYPRDPVTDALDPRQSGDPKNYKAASLYLYKALSGDNDANGIVDTNDDRSGSTPKVKPKTYMPFNRSQLSWTDPVAKTPPVLYIADAFGNSYGYSTAYQADVDKEVTPTHGYNPTFDLWSTANAPTTKPLPGVQGDVTVQWIKNW
jgi:prepilin-type N-terminal cleavage/methylation domain-containing protein